MYHEIGIQHLSPTQISRILNGHAVRVKHGSGHKIHVSKEQHKKIMSAHRKGSAVNLTMDPFQISQHQHLRGHTHGHGDGFLSNVGSKLSSMVSQSPDYALQLAKLASPYAMEAGRALLPVAQELGTAYAKKQLGVGAKRRGRRGHGGALLPAGYGVHHSHRVPHHAHHFAKHGHGDGFLQDIGSFALPIATELGTAYAKKKLGVGRKGGRRKGKGVIGQTLGSIFGQMLPI